MKGRYLLTGVLIGIIWLTVLGVSIVARDAIFWTFLVAFFTTWIVADRGLKIYTCSRHDHHDHDSDYST